MADDSSSDSSVWGGLQNILSQGISAYVDTQIAGKVYANNPVPQVYSPYGLNSQGQPVAASQAAFSNPVTWGLIAVVGIGLVLLVTARR
jgi:hypothetical protein